MTKLSDNALTWMSDYLSSRLGLTIIISHCTNGYLLKNGVNEFILPRVTTSEKKVIFFEFSGSRFCRNLENKRIYGYETSVLPTSHSKCEATKTNTDFITFMFDHLNRVEEFWNGALDTHGRFQLKNSMAYKFGYYDEPVVDHIIEYLKDLYCKAGFEINKQDKSSILITHDIDSAYRYNFTSLISLAKFFISRIIRRDFRSIYAYILFLLSKSADPYDTYDFLMDVSERYNTRSYFFFIPNRNSLRWDGNYSLNSKKIEKLLKRIHSRGHFIGAHFSYFCYDDPIRIKSEYAKINEICENSGVFASFTYYSRMHYLRWSSWKTAKALANAGVKIDTTMGYAEELSFRSGTCHPYYPFCIEDDCKVFVKIIPLTIMEGTVWGENYMNIKSHDKIKSAMKKQIDKVKEVNGTINILWHNSDLDADWKKQIYAEIVKYASDQ